MSEGTALLGASASGTNPTQAAALPAAVSSGRRAAKDKNSCVKKTLDVHHTQRVHQLYKAQGDVQEKKAELTALRSRIVDLHAMYHDNRSDEIMEEMLELQDNAYALDLNVRRLEEDNNELKYLLDTGDILFKYYDIVEKGAPIAPSHVSTHTHTTTAPSCPKDVLGHRHSILAWFHGSTPAQTLSQQQPKLDNEVEHQSPLLTLATIPASSTPSKSRVSRGPNASVSNADQPVLSENKAALFERYMAATQGMAYTRHNNTSVPDCAGGGSASKEVSGTCRHCGSSSITIQANEGLLYCNVCATVEYVVMDHDKPSYKDPPKEISYWAYKRINHFNEWLNQTQARQSTEIPEELYDRILLEIKKQRITNMAELTPAKIKEILKKLKGDARKYYEHIPFIIHRLNGKPMPHFSPELEEQLRSMFRAIQVPFSRAVLVVCPNRKNFLSYSFVLHKFMQLLGLDEYVHIFQLLRSREKLHQQDQIWKLICEELQWEFIPSM